MKLSIEVKLALARSLLAEQIKSKERFEEMKLGTNNKNYISLHVGNNEAIDLYKSTDGMLSVVNTRGSGTVATVHLMRDEAGQLARILQHYADTGELSPDGINPKVEPEDEGESEVPDEGKKASGITIIGDVYHDEDFYIRTETAWKKYVGLSCYQDGGSEEAHEWEWDITMEPKTARQVGALLIKAADIVSGRPELKRDELLVELEAKKRQMSIMQLALEFIRDYRRKVYGNGSDFAQMQGRARTALEQVKASERIE